MTQTPASVRNLINRVKENTWVRCYALKTLLTMYVNLNTFMVADDNF